MTGRILPPDGISVRRWCDPARFFKLRGMGKVSDNPMNIFVAENTPEIRKRIVAMVQTIAGINVIGEAESVSEAIDGVLGSTADALLLDLQLKDGTGLKVLARVKQVRPELHVIVLTNMVASQYRESCLSAGAEFCLDKSREFGLVPGILRSWLDAAGDRPVA